MHSGMKHANLDSYGRSTTEINQSVLGSNELVLRISSAKSFFHHNDITFYVFNVLRMAVEKDAFLPQHVTCFFTSF